MTWRDYGDQVAAVVGLPVSQRSERQLPGANLVIGCSPIDLRGMVHSQSLRHETWLARGSSGAVLEAPAFVAGLDDVQATREAIEQGGGHLGVAEHRGPSAEARLVVTMIDSPGGGLSGGDGQCRART